MSLPETITVTLDGNKKTVSTSDYVRAKRRQLIEFGYDDLTEAVVSKQLEKLLAGEKLSVIGMFMKSEVECPPATTPVDEKE